MFFGTLSPSSPDPCLVVVCVLLLLFVWLVSSTPCSLFFSLSLRRWGNPNLLRGVWGSPCVSSSWTSSPTSIRTPCPSPSSRSRPAPVFFFAVDCFLVRVFARFWSWSCLASPGVGLGRSVFRLFVVVGNGLACCFCFAFCIVYMH